MTFQETLMLTDEQLAAIKQRADVYSSIVTGPMLLIAAEDSARDVPTLLADNALLRKELAFYLDQYTRVEKVLDRAHGPNEEDGAGQGQAADVHLLMQQRDEARALVPSESAMREVIASAEQSAMTVRRWRPVVDAARQLRAAYGTGLGDGYVALRGLLSAVADLELSESPPPDAFRREFLILLPESVDVDAAQARLDERMAAWADGEVAS